MPIKSSELSGAKAPTLSVEGRLKANTGHDKYNDWHEDDTERDPTPSNKRRTEMFKATKPTEKTNRVADSHSKKNTKGTTSQEYFAGLPEGN